MSLLDAVHIQQRQADLRPSLPRKLASLAPLLFAAALACFAVAFVLGERTPGSSHEDAVLVLVPGAILFGWSLWRLRRRIALLEIEVLELRRRLEDRR